MSPFEKAVVFLMVGALAAYVVKAFMLPFFF